MKITAIPNADDSCELGEKLLLAKYKNVYEVVRRSLKKESRIRIWLRTKLMRTVQTKNKTKELDKSAAYAL